MKKKELKSKRLRYNIRNIIISDFNLNLKNLNILKLQISYLTLLQPRYFS